MRWKAVATAADVLRRWKIHAATARAASARDERVEETTRDEGQLVSGTLAKRRSQ
jgi:hypothetical protein